MKKIWILIILTILLFSPNVYAEEKPTFSIKSIQSSPNQEITFSVNLKNNPNYEYISLEIPLDARYLEYISCDINGYSNALMKECDLNPYNEIIFYALTLETKEDKLLKETGNIIDVHVKIKENADTDIPLPLKVTSFSKNDEEKIDYDVEIGFIRISGDIKTKAINETENLGKEIKEEKNDTEVTWSSSDQEVATVDEEGNVEFTGTGNATIKATDEEGNVLYEKTYLVNHKKKKSYKKYFLLTIPVLFIGIIIFWIWKKRKGKKK